MLSEFSCSGNKQGLCLFDSVCSETGRYCLCKPGFMNDFSFLHQPNCGMPWYSYLVFFCIFTAPWLIIGFVLIRELFQAKNKVITVFGIKALLFHAALMFLSIGLFAQGGFYEVAALAGPLSQILMFRLLVRMFMMMFSFSHGIYQDRVKVLWTMLNTVSFVHMSLQISLGITILVFCRSANLALYDTMIFTLVMSHYICIIVLGIIALKFTNEFLAYMKTQNMNFRFSHQEFANTLDDVRTRVRTLKWRWIIALTVLTVISVATLILRCVLTSVPYMFVPFLFMIFIAPLLVLVSPN